jgi:hypothetical protein
VNKLDNFVLSIVFVRGNCKALHLVQGGALSIFCASCARVTLTTILLVGGLGVEDDEDDQGGLGVEDDEDDQGGLGVEDDDHKIISSCGVGLKRAFLIKTKNAC